jgi:hypothetical protein
MSVHEVCFLCFCAFRLANAVLDEENTKAQKHSPSLSLCFRCAFCAFDTRMQAPRTSKGTESTEGTEGTKAQKAQVNSMENRPPPTDRIAELLARYALGQFKDSPAVNARLAAIFSENPSPPGTFDRLLRACEHLRVTGEHADELVHLAALEALAKRPAVDYAAEQETAA